MATIRELIPYTNTLSLLYIDENQELLTTVVDVLKQSFASVDDASSATAGIGYARLNKYDLMIIDSTSAVMDIL